MSGPELSVVCKSCSSEVSPYVTECPYCGHRIRKRAPKLERDGDGIHVKEKRSERRKRERAERSADRGSRRRVSLPDVDIDQRPVATAAGLTIAAVLLVLQRGIPLNLSEAGAIAGPVNGELWRYLSAPFVYSDVGALLVIGLVIALAGSALERRLGSVATATLIIATGSLGMLAADAAASAGLETFQLAAGGNGIALGLLGAWWMLERTEDQDGPYAEPYDALGALVATAVMLLMPLVEETADPVAGIVGGLVGLGFGWMLVRRGVVGD